MQAQDAAGLLSLNLLIVNIANPLQIITKEYIAKNKGQKKIFHSLKG